VIPDYPPSVQSGRQPLWKVDLAGLIARKDRYVARLVLHTAFLISTVLAWYCFIVAHNRAGAVVSMAAFIVWSAHLIWNGCGYIGCIEEIYSREAALRDEPLGEP
jgi:hypothetical protein